MQDRQLQKGRGGVLEVDGVDGGEGVWYNGVVNKVMSALRRSSKLRLAPVFNDEGYSYACFADIDAQSASITQKGEDLFHKMVLSKMVGFTLITLLTNSLSKSNPLLLCTKKCQNSYKKRAFLGQLGVVAMAVGLGWGRIGQVRAADPVTTLTFEVESDSNLTPTGWEVGLYNQTTGAMVKTLAIPIAGVVNKVVTVDLGAVSNYSVNTVYQLWLREEFVLAGSDAQAGDEQMKTWTSWQAIMSDGVRPVTWCVNVAGGFLYAPEDGDLCRTSTLPDTPDIANFADPTIGAFASYVAGFNSLVLAGTAKDEDIGQTLTIQYQIDGTAGSWSNLTTIVADGSEQSWSGTVTLPAGLADGSHTVYVRVYDGHDYSSGKSVTFYLDDTVPTNTASLVGGVLCTGIPTIYCSAPTGISLAASSDAAAGIGAYRTAWDTAFSSGDVSPVWTTINPPTTTLPDNLTTAGHTTESQTHTLYYQTRDKVGNVSAVGNINYYINSTPEITLNDADHDHILSVYTPLVFSGTFTDADAGQTATVRATIDGVDYLSQTYVTTGGEIKWEIIISPTSLQGLSPSELTNIPIMVTDSAATSDTISYTGQISLVSVTTSQIYISVMRDAPFSITIGKVGAFNITYGTNSGITVATNAQSEIIVSGSLDAPASIPFGVTTLVFTVLDEPSTQVQNVEFI
ncbi:hypothetical protein FWH30_01595 [Microgenomates group bacterium]|nr:hypothetical protein [Microgenomates group bacterium]